MHEDPDSHSPPPNNGSASSSDSMIGDSIFDYRGGGREGVWEHFPVSLCRGTETMGRFADRVWWCYEVDASQMLFHLLQNYIRFFFFLFPISLTDFIKSVFVSKGKYAA